LGEPGSGKSTTLLAFTREKANERLENVTAPLPVYAPLSTWDGASELPDWLANATALDPAALRREIAANRTLLILDGLDEMAVERPDSTKPDVKPRDFRVVMLEKLKSVETPALVSCRVRDYDEIVGKGGEKIALNGAVTLQPLSDAQIQAYLGDQPELWDALQSDSALLDMARTPLLLTLLAVGYRDSTPAERLQLRHLSASPGDLRDRIFRNYIAKRYEHERLHSLDPLPFSLEALIEGLGRAALNMLGDWNRTDWTKIAQLDVDSAGVPNLADFAVRLHLLQPLGMAKIERSNYRGNEPEQFQWRFLHLLLRDYLAFPPALAALFIPDKVVRLRAASALGNIADPRAVEPLIAALADSDENVRSNAASALGQIADPRAVEPLLLILYDSDSDVSASAAVALGRIADPRVVEPLIAMLSDSKSEVSFGAAYVIGQIADPRVVEPLISVLTHPNADVRSNAAYALGQNADPRVVELLISALSDPNADVRINAIYALGHRGDPRAILPLKVRLRDDDENFMGEIVCDAAADALILIGTPDALAAVEAWRQEQGNNPKQ
jgi:HEAT repeat protein